MIKFDMGCRYSHNLENVLNKLEGEEILFLNYDDDYQGFVDIDVLLKDGRIFSYEYSYGSCSGCDTWEAEGFDEDKIEDVMLREASFLDNMNQYIQWCESLPDKRNMWSDDSYTRKGNVESIKEKYSKYKVVYDLDDSLFEV